jgi:GntR family transcriptional regulator, carbon starvation induced regulator
MRAPDATARSLTAKVSVQIRRDILEMRWSPDSKLRLDDLRAEYRVGLSPLREALSRLAAEGLVVSEDQRGFRVTPASLADLDDLTRLRSHIEASALSRSIERGDDSWEADLVRAHHHLSLAALTNGGSSDAGILEWERRHQAFHDALVAACASPRLLRLRSQLFDQFLRYLRLAVEAADTPPQAIATPRDAERYLAVAHAGFTRDPGAEHEALTAAALSRDVARCVELIGAHIRLTADFVARIERGLALTTGMA